MERKCGEHTKTKLHEFFLQKDLRSSTTNIDINLFTMDRQCNCYCYDLYYLLHSLHEIPKLLWIIIKKQCWRWCSLTYLSKINQMYRKETFMLLVWCVYMFFLSKRKKYFSILKKSFGCQKIWLSTYFQWSSLVIVQQPRL
jgi:hypothetical protein